MLGVDAESDALDVLPIGAAEEGRRARRRAAGGGRPSMRTSIIAALVVVGVAVVAWQVLGGDDAPADDGSGDSDAAGTADLADFDGLIDGDTIELFVADLPGSVDTVTIQCVPDAAAGTGCDPTTSHRAVTAPNGIIEEAVQVWRVISTAEHDSYDCARRPCEVRTYPPAAGTPVATRSLGFDTQNSAALPVQIWVAQPDPTTDELITVQTNALTEGTELGVTGCALAADGAPGCNQLWSRQVIAEANGLEFDIPAAWWQGNFETLCPDGCRIDFDLPTQERQPFSIHLPASNRAGLMVDSGSDDIPTELTVTPSTGLLDGQEVTLEAAGLTNEMGLYLCADTIVFDCSWLGAPVTADVQTVRVPRAFTSWRGGLRDCAEVECEIVVLGPMNFDDQVSAVIAFDPSVPLEPGRPLSIDTDEPIADGQTVTISVDPNEGAMEWPNMAVCAVDRTETCEYVDSNFSDNAVTVTLYRTLNTPTGPYDCIDDGSCELNVWIDGRTSRFEPLALEFDPDAPQARQPATVTIRPSGEISDGDTISLTVRGLSPDEFVVFASICITGETSCAFLGGIDGGQSSSTTLDLRIRRVITMQNLTTPGAAGPVDCLVVQCEIRLSNVQAGEPAVLNFRDEPALPNPEIAIDLPAERVPTERQFDVRGRFFTFISLDDEHWLDVHLCRPADEPGTYESCYSVGAIADDGIDVDAGTFEGTITLPDEAPGFRVGGNATCDVDCLLVVFDGAGPPGVLPITIDR